VLNDPTHVANPPGRALLSAHRRRQSHTFVRHLPVTTEIARVIGTRFYGFPKFLAVVEFTDEETRRVCRLEEGGEHILTLAADRLPTSPGGECQYFHHLWMQRQPQLAEIRANNLELGASLRPGAATLTPGEHHPIAAELDRMLLSKRSLYSEYTPSSEGILFAPQHLTPIVLERMRDAREAARTAVST